MTVGSERWLACAIVAVAGCSQILDLGDFHLGGGDAGGDGGTTPPGDATGVPGPTCGFSSVFDTCGNNATFGSAITIDGSATYDTGSDMILIGGVSAEPVTVRFTLDPDDPNLVVAVVLVSGLTITGTGTLTVTGTNAFGVASTGDVEIDGSLIAPPGAQAAGSRSVPACGNQAGTKGVDGISFAPGGGGGAFQGSGGAAGSGEGHAGGAGGVGMTAVPTFPIGGCPGAQGGEAGANDVPLPSIGGGAIYLASKTRIDVGSNASISAGGQGGAGGESFPGAANGDGGGGGASGGMIWLEAMMIEVDGTLVADGGGGGQGGYFTPATETNAAAGADGDTFGAALGGSGSGAGGAGGTGGAGATVAAAMGQTNASGGGGGGGAGFVVLTTAPGGLADANAKISPAPNVFVEVP